jgi:hypothetical protein
VEHAETWERRCVPFPAAWQTIAVLLSAGGRIHLRTLQRLESISDGELMGKLAIDAAPLAPTAVISGGSTTVESLSSRRDLDGLTLEPSACAAKSPCSCG